MKKVNLDSLYVVYGSRINASTSEDELWSVCGTLISLLRDGHITLFNRNYSKYYWSADIDQNKSKGFSFNLIIEKYIKDTRVAGEGTTGCLGEVTQVGQLTNGWTLNFPCTLVTLPDGSSPEGAGVQPDIFVENTATDIAEGIDKVIEAASEHLRGTLKKGVRPD